MDLIPLPKPKFLLEILYAIGLYETSGCHDVILRIFFLEVFKRQEGTFAVLDLIKNDQGVVRSNSYIVE